jgi:hypothetical protein
MWMLVGANRRTARRTPCLPQCNATRWHGPGMYTAFEAAPDVAQQIFPFRPLRKSRNYRQKYCRPTIFDTSEPCLQGCL